MSKQVLQQVDHSALKANQITIIAFSLLGFIFDLSILTLITALVMGIGTIFKVPGFVLMYRYFYKPLGILKPDVLLDNPEPHQFSQLLGFVFLTSGSLAVFLGAPLFGWGLVWLVIGLAALNAFGGFCVGCALYYWLARFQVPGFTKMPPAGTIPGMKPKIGI